MTAGKPTSNEERVTFACDGHQEDLETIKTPIFDSDGRLSSILGIGRNITERKQAEQALLASEEKFSMVYHLSPDAIDLTHLAVSYTHLPGCTPGPSASSGRGCRLTAMWSNCCRKSAPTSIP